MKVKVIIVAVKSPDGSISTSVIEDMSEKVCFGAFDNQGFRVWFEDEAYFVVDWLHNYSTSKVKIYEKTVDVPDDF